MNNWKNFKNHYKLILMKFSEIINNKMINQSIKSTLQNMKFKIKICYKNNLLTVKIKLLKKFNNIMIMKL